MNLTYDKGRGFHWWECTECGGTWYTRVPDQADIEYGATRASPWLAPCPNCNGGHLPVIRLVSRTPRRWSPNDDVDGGDPHLDGHLDGEWGQWAKVAAIYARRVPFEDRPDFRHDVIVELAKVKAKYQAKGKPLTEAGMMRVAAYERMQYWEREKLRGRGIVVNCRHCSKAQRQACRDGDLYVQCRKAVQVFSLYAEVQDDGKGDGEPTELREILADDQALDLDKWMDDRTWLASFPRRLVAIAQKVVDGIPLAAKDQEYLRRFRQNLAQKRLI